MIKNTCFTFDLNQCLSLSIFSGRITDSHFTKSRHRARAAATERLSQCLLTNILKSPHPDWLLSGHGRRREGVGLTLRVIRQRRLRQPRHVELRDRLRGAAETHRTDGVLRRDHIKRQVVLGQQLRGRSIHPSDRPLGAFVKSVTEGRGGSWQLLC